MFSSFKFFFALLLGLLALASDAVRGQEIMLLPAEFTLHGPENIQRISVVNVDQGRLASMVDAGEAEYRVKDSSIAEIENGVVRGLRNGETEIEVSVQGRTSSARVKVVNCDRSAKWNFRQHVQSVLAKNGCNMGACHGALAGKGGFKLSLRGHDSEADFQAITRKARGRRIDLTEPGRSLFLAKPTAALPHKEA